MKHHLTRLLAVRLSLSILAILIILAAMCLPNSQAFAEESIDKMVASTATANDHRPIEAYYARKAKEAESEAKLHLQLANEYKKFNDKPNLARHCKVMAKYYQQLANEYKAMAAEHHQMTNESAN